MTSGPFNSGRGESRTVAAMTDAVRGELGRILSSQAFRCAISQKRFLAYAVEEVLAGRGRLVKEYSIGVEVLGKGEQFDPRLNAIVRLEARKIRRNLQKYYDTEGFANPLRIELPKGRYAPAFVLPPARVRPNDLPALKESGEPATKTGRSSSVSADESACSNAFGIAGSTIAWKEEIRPVVIAILPFQARTVGSRLRSFAQGVTDELTNALGQLAELQVVARSSAALFEDGAVDIRTAGRMLGADAVLEGSVRQSGKRLRLTTQLNATSTGYCVWSGNYDRKLRDPLDLQGELAATVLEALRTCVRPDLAGVRTRGYTPPQREEHASLSAVPHQLVPREFKAGVAFAAKQSPADLQAAIRCFRNVLELDASFAPAYAELAKAYVLLPFVSAVPLSEMAEQISTCAEKALEIDHQHGPAHTALAVRSIYDFDWNTAGSRFRNALDLAPGDALAHSWYASYLLNVGRGDEALKERQMALQLKPGEAVTLHQFAETFYYLRRFEEAIDHYRRALALDPTLPRAHQAMGLACIHLRSFARGLMELERYQELVNGSVRARADCAYGHAMAGNSDRARQVLHDFTTSYREDFFPAVAIARIYVGLGEKELAFDWLHRAVEQKDWVLFLKSDPVYDSLRSDARFEVLLRRMNLQ
jgi:TolB-like protein/tetratricopeptide (TPR) repeat protein